MTTLLQPRPAIARVEPEPAVTCEGLTKRYGDVLALDRLCLEVPAGSVFGLLGPNGAGKTTTLRLLTGLSRPSEGTARVAGVGVARGHSRLAATIGYLDQDPRFYPWMTGEELLRFVGRLFGLRGGALTVAVRGALEIAGLGEDARRRIGGYSGGMRQRLGLAQALINRPAVLFLDEPVSSLDPQGRHDLLETIAGLRGTATVVLSTHILADVERVCDRVGILDHGRLLVTSEIHELLARFAEPVHRLEIEPARGPAAGRLVVALRAAGWDVDLAAGAPGLVVRGGPGLRAGDLLRRIVESGVEVQRYERMTPGLEDVFLRLVGGDGPREKS